MKKIVDANEEEIQEPEVVESKPLEEIKEPSFKQANFPEKKSNKSTIIIVVILIVVLIGLIMYWNYTKNKKQ